MTAHGRHPSAVGTILGMEAKTSSCDLTDWRGARPLQASRWGTRWKLRGRHGASCSSSCSGFSQPCPRTRFHVEQHEVPNKFATTKATALERQRTVQPPAGRNGSRAPAVYSVRRESRVPHRAICHVRQSAPVLPGASLDSLLPGLLRHGAWHQRDVFDAERWAVAGR